MGRMISVTLVSLMLRGRGGGGYRIRIFLFGLVREFQRCFCDRRYSAIKRGVHKDLLADHQRHSLKAYILITFYLIPLQSRIV